MLEEELVKVSKGVGVWEDKATTEVGPFCSAPCFNNFHVFLFIFLSLITLINVHNGYQTEMKNMIGKS